MNPYEKITEVFVRHIDHAIEHDTPLVWQRDWTADSPRSYNGREYAGLLNQLVLNAEKVTHQYKSNIWLTFKKTSELGGKVKKGEKSTIVTFWKPITVKEDDEERTIPLLRYYNVFNVDQTDIELEFEEVDFTILDAEQLIKNWKDCPDIKNHPEKAFYRVGEDTVYIPDMSQFKSAEGYYQTLFHELIHSTGHKDRLNRSLKNGFGSEKYGIEELIAEIGSAFLCNKTGIAPKIDNSIAYLRGWLKAVKDDIKMIIYASQRSQKAVNYIIGD